MGIIKIKKVDFERSSYVAKYLDLFYEQSKSNQNAKHLISVKTEALTDIIMNTFHFWVNLQVIMLHEQSQTTKPCSFYFHSHTISEVMKQDNYEPMLSRDWG